SVAPLRRVELRAHRHRVVDDDRERNGRAAATIERQTRATHARRRREQPERDDRQRAHREQRANYEVRATPRDGRRRRNETRRGKHALLRTTPPEQMRDERPDDGERNEKSERDEELHPTSTPSPAPRRCRKPSHARA